MRHIVVTGATDGIGKVTARELGTVYGDQQRDQPTDSGDSATPTTIWIVGRNSEKTAATVRELQQLRPLVTYRGLVADLSLGSQVRRLANEIKDQIPQLDVLVNNAGALFGSYEQTPEGFERTFALNHLNYFILTHHLLPLVQRSQRGRIICVASEAHRGQQLDFENLQGERRFSSWQAYGRSKLCNILFTRQLAKRLAGSHVTVNCLHPGFVASKFGHNNPGVMTSIFKVIQKALAISEDDGAKTSVYLASSPEVANVNGQYFAKCRAKTPSVAAQDDTTAAQLWTRSEQLAASFL